MGAAKVKEVKVKVVMVVGRDTMVVVEVVEEVEARDLEVSVTTSCRSDQISRMPA